MSRAYLNGRHRAQSGEKSSAGVGQHIYIGQFSDASGLSYLNARYYNPTQGQFTSEDPVFWGQQNLQDPQSFNAYSYSENNPIMKEDPSGKKYGDANETLVVPTELGLSVGPTGGVLIDPSQPNNPYVYFGVAAAPLDSKPAYSSSLTYSNADLGQGFSFSGSYFSPLNIGGVFGYALTPDGKLEPYSEWGSGTQGLSGSITYAVSVNKLLTALGGPFENITTPMTGFKGGSSSAAQYADLTNLLSNSSQARISATQSFNSSARLSSGGGVSAGGASVPKSNSLWATPSGAVVTFGGQTISGPLK